MDRKHVINIYEQFRVFAGEDIARYYSDSASKAEKPNPHLIEKLEVDCGQGGGTDHLPGCVCMHSPCILNLKAADILKRTYGVSSIIGLDDMNEEEKDSARYEPYTIMYNEDRSKTPETASIIHNYTIIKNPIMASLVGRFMPGK